MDVNEETLRERYGQLSNDELAELHQNGMLTDIAQVILERELASRGISLQEAENIEIPSLKEIEKKARKEQVKIVVRRLWARLGRPIVAILIIAYAFQFLDWMKENF